MGSIFSSNCPNERGPHLVEIIPSSFFGGGGKMQEPAGMGRSRRCCGRKIIWLLMILAAMVCGGFYGSKTNYVQEKLHARAMLGHQYFSECGCPYKWAPVCAEDGMTYGNHCMAACKSMQVIEAHACSGSAGTMMMHHNPGGY
jgi:hypothetical protein